jgi:hypothetical protein
MPAVWANSENIHSFTDPDEQAQYLPEMVQQAAAAALWSDVKPRVAMQQQIPRR